MSGPRTFRSYEEFFSFYLEQHREPGHRWMHAIGSILGLITAIVAFATHHPWYALLWIPLGYGFCRLLWRQGGNRAATSTCRRPSP